MELFRCQISGPRLSFSLDFTPGYASNRVSPEKPICLASDETEFEFRMFSNEVDVKHDVGEKQLGGGGEREYMVSADRLFSDGKLRPLIPAPPSSSLVSPRHEHKLSLHKAQIGPRFDGFGVHHDPVPCLSGANCKSSPPRRPPLPPVSSVSPLKYSTKILEFFKLKRVPLTLCMEPLPTQLSRHESATSNCKLPVSHKAFWPFYRSNSAVESKITAPVVPALPRRSNSASMTTSSTSISKSADANGLATPYGASSFSPVGSSVSQGKSTCFSISTRSSERMKNRPESIACSFPVPTAAIQRLSSASEESCSLSVCYSLKRKSSSLSLERADPNSRESSVLPKVSGSVEICDSPKQSYQLSNAVVAFKDFQKTALMNSTKARGCTSSESMRRRGFSDSARIVTRGSPGKRMISNVSGVKSNESKIVLRNLQRRSAGTNLGVARKQQVAGGSDGSKGSQRFDSDSVTLRVGPSLNVDMCKKTAPKTGNLSLRNLFSSKSQTTGRSPLNNWRNGA